MTEYRQISLMSLLLMFQYFAHKIKTHDTIDNAEYETFMSLENAGTILSIANVPSVDEPRRGEIPHKLLRGQGICSSLQTAVAQNKFDFLSPNDSLSSRNCTFCAM